MYSGEKNSKGKGERGMTRIPILFAILYVILCFSLGFMIERYVSLKNENDGLKSYVCGLECVIEHNLTAPRGWNTQFYLDLARDMSNKHLREGR